MATKTTTVSSTHSKLVSVPGLIVGCVDNGVESWDHTTGCLHVVGTAAIPAGGPLQVFCVLRRLVGLVHLAVWPWPRGV